MQIDPLNRFRMWRWQFDMIVDGLRAELEPQTEWAKQCAINSSGSWVKAELKFAATMRFLAGGSYLDAADLYAVSAKCFHRNTFWPVILALVNSKHPFLDNICFPFDDEQNYVNTQRHFKGFTSIFRALLPLATVVRSKSRSLALKKSTTTCRAPSPVSIPGLTALFCSAMET